MIFSWFECEGLGFQAFTAQEAFLLLFSWLPTIFRREGLLLRVFTSVRSRCECFEFQAITPKAYENQLETHTVWRSECFFREIKTVYTRAQKGYIKNKLRIFRHGLPASPATPGTAWIPFHKSPTISPDSTSGRNNSWTCERHIIRMFL